MLSANINLQFSDQCFKNGDGLLEWFKILWIHEFRKFDLYFLILW